MNTDANNARIFNAITNMTRSYLSRGQFTYYSPDDNVFKTIEGVMNKRVYWLEDEDQEQYLTYTHTTPSGREYGLRDVIKKQIEHWEAEEEPTTNGLGWDGLTDL
jgi:hypothetical protein